MNKECNIFLTTAFGLEAVAKRELFSQGFDNLTVEDGRISFKGLLNDIPRLNLWMRTADRVYLMISEFNSTDFESLFNNVACIPWKDYIDDNQKIIVNGKSVKSKLHFVPACQSIIKKAVIKSISEADNKRLPETGSEIRIFFSILKDRVTIALDSSGDALFKRGYKSNVEATLKETLAAGIVLISRWNKESLLIDPMCGAGTILIEAGMIAKNIAPGIQRRFAAESWKFISPDIWDKARKNAKKARKKRAEKCIFGYDSDASAIDIAISNAKIAGVDDIVRFEVKKLDELWIDQENGTMITDPPYGIRLENAKTARKIIKQLGKMFRKKSGWSSFILSPSPEFQSLFGRKPDRKRKLYNGKIKVNLFQYMSTLLP